jgi:hypothetical protein
MTNHSTDHSRRTPMQLCGKRPDQSSNQGYTVTEMASPHLSRWLMAVMISTVSVTPRWRLLGPRTALNCVLLFGWSTAVIFEVLRKRPDQGPGERIDLNQYTRLSAN